MKPDYYLVRYQCSSGLIVEQSHENEKQARKAAANLSQSHDMVFSCEIFDTDNNPCLGLVTKWIGGKAGEIVNRNMQPLEPLDKTQRRIKPMAKTVDTTKRDQSTETNTNVYKQAKKSRTPSTRATRVDGVTATEGTIGGDAVPNTTLADEKKAMKKANPKLKPTKVDPSETEHIEAKRPAKISGKLEKIEGETEIPTEKFARIKRPAKLRKISKTEAKEINVKIARRAGTISDTICNYFSARINVPILLETIAADLNVSGTAVNNAVATFKRLANANGVPVALSSERLDGAAARTFVLA